MTRIRCCVAVSRMQDPFALATSQACSRLGLHEYTRSGPTSQHEPADASFWLRFFPPLSRALWCRARSWPCLGRYPLFSFKNLVAVLTARQVNIETKGWRTVWVRHGAACRLGLLRDDRWHSGHHARGLQHRFLQACATDLLQLPHWSSELLQSYMTCTYCSAWAERNRVSQVW